LPKIVVKNAPIELAKKIIKGETIKFNSDYARKYYYSGLADTKAEESVIYLMIQGGYLTKKHRYNPNKFVIPNNEVKGTFCQELLKIWIKELYTPCNLEENPEEEIKIASKVKNTVQTF
jgi:hypothetical protein